MSEIVIRAPRSEDVAALTMITNLPGVRRGTMRMPFTPEEFIRKRLLEASPAATPVVAELDGAAVGQGALILRQGRQRHMGEVFLLVHDDHWGRGVGTALMTALLDLADSWYGLQRLQLECLVDNSRAMALYERFGFETEGRLRAALLADGVLMDVFVMGRLRPAPGP